MHADECLNSLCNIYLFRQKHEDREEVAYELQEQGPYPSNVSKQLKTLINLIDSWYRPMALATELEELKSSADERACLRSVDNIDRLVAQQLKVCVRACERAYVHACGACVLNCVRVVDLNCRMTSMLHDRYSSRHQATRSVLPSSTNG